MNYKDKLKELIEKRRGLILVKRELLSLGKEDTRGVNLLTREIAKLDDNLFNFKNEIVSASVFDIHSISKTLIDLIRVYDGEDFVLLKSVNYVDDTCKDYPFGDYPFGEVDLLINEEKRTKRTNFITSINIMQKEGNVIPLNWNKGSNKIAFYYKKNNDLFNIIKLNKFPYLKEFIDFVISYKIENNIKKDLTLEELEILKREFIKDHLDEIHDYHDIIIFETKRKYEEKLESDLQYKSKILKREIKKYTENK